MQVGNFRAGFDTFDVRVEADDQIVRMEGRVPAESLTIKNPPEFREHVLNGEDFFDANNHPDILFSSSDVRLAEDGTFSGDGELTIRGITHVISATGTYEPLVDDPFGSRRTAIELKAIVDRRKWGMDWQMALPNGTDSLGYEVELTAHIELVEQR